MAPRIKTPTGDKALIQLLRNIDKSTGAHSYAQPLHLSTGEVVVLVGPNGVGKSALLYEIGRSIRFGYNVEQFSGFRQISFHSDDIDQVGLSLPNFFAQLNDQQVNRMRNPWGDQHLKSVMRRIVDRQYQDSYDILEAQNAGIDYETAKKENSLIIDDINSVFEAGRLSIKIVLEDGGLKAKREGTTYGIQRMSDGERAALMLVGAILVRPISSWITIDEPEKHLNPAISGPLIAAAIRSRPDLGYIFATHDLNLIDWMSPSKIIHISNSQVMSTDPEFRAYNMEILGNSKLPNESLKTAVFGSRKALLLVEGTQSSNDEALFGFIYDGWNVIGRGDWESVSSEVKSINNNNEYHWIKVAGIIDGDGRSTHEINKLSKNEVFALPAPTIENLFFYEPVVLIMIELNYNMTGGDSIDERLLKYQSTLVDAINKAKEDIITRRVVWRANRELSAKKISVQDVRAGQQNITETSIEDIRKAITAEISNSINNDAPHDLIMKVTIKNTGIPKSLSVALGYGDFSKYQQSVLHQLQIGSPYGKIIKQSLLDILPKLPEIQ